MEGRHTRRLVRYWIFLSIAFLLGIGFHFYYSTLHALFSSISASVGMIGPRYLMTVIALYYLTGFVLGIVFLAFDVRARDVREGIVEVLDARPLTNFELVAGRFVALFLAAWVPMIILVLLIQGLGVLLPLLGSPIGRTVEPLSLVNFAVLMAVPAIAFAIALVFVITLLVRHRLIAALLSVALIVGVYWMLFTISATAAPLVDFIGISQVTTPSDLVPALLIPGGGLQRAAVLVLALGLLGVAAAIHPRLDGGRRLKPAAASIAVLLAGCVGLAVVADQRLGAAERVDTWRSAHEARAAEPTAGIRAIRGEVVIDPGRSLAADLELVLEAPPDAELRRVLLTLNPGLEVRDVRSAGGAALAAEHENGLLDIELERPLAAGERIALQLQYAGRPDVGFGYLDSAIMIDRLDMNESQIGLLGYEVGVFDRRYAALTPGLRWLPASGVDVGRGDPRLRRTDYFELELEVDVPSTWLAAGPGKREPGGGAADRARFRFAPAVRVPEVAVMAAELESYATEIDGITFELLLHPDHADNIDVLADSRGEIEQWIADRLEVAADAGLEYPFDAFTVVEVPNTLRGYAGGWRLDTALAPPAMMLLRETSFPTARFDFDIVAVMGNRNPDQDGGTARINRDRLVSFFSNDFSGGNVFTGAARSFFVHRTSAFGPEAIALDFVLEELATLLVSGQRSYFSAHLFQNINQAAVAVVSNMSGASGMTDALINAQTRQTAVWDAALDAPLSGFDPWQDPQRTIDLLTLKGGGTAHAIHDALGPEAVGALLAELLARRAGDSFTLADVVAAGEHVDEDLGPLLEDWVHSTGMPGFVAERVELYRLPDDGRGDTRYQVLIRIANPEPVVGFTRVAWSMERGGDRTFSEPIRVPARAAIEYGVVLSEPPAVVYVHPYLSLNREDFVAGLVDLAEPVVRDAAPLDGVRAAPPGQVRDERIVADDLDERFAIETGGGAAGDRRLTGRGGPVTGLDEGLPIATGPQPPRAWSRRTNETAWGRYRHTMTYVGAGDGSRRAVLPVTIPAPGVWELEIHLPFMPFLQAPGRGTWHLEIVSDNGRESVSYDATVANVGWNLVGAYELPAGEVRVEISDRTDGRMVVADAIGWSPLRVEREAPEANGSGAETPAADADASTSQGEAATASAAVAGETDPRAASAVSEADSR